MLLPEVPRRTERLNALRNSVQTTPRKVERTMDQHGHAVPISEYFGSLTFGLAQMREKIPREAYQGLLRTLDHGKKLTKETADAVASAVKEWSVSKGVTHYCHWFQPMTGLTAEKH